MTTSKFIQNEYNRLYSQMRRYIWPFDIIEILAELETQVYEAFPNLTNIRNTFYTLKREIKNISNKGIDDELSNSLDDFEKIIIDDGDLYLSIKQVREVI